jgi:DNA-binding transcriptional LysR family regulator
MDRLHAMEVFVAVADAGNFARAALRLRLSPPAVTRAVAALEDRLGARVFNRTTRRLSLTETGARFLENSRRLLSEIDNAEKDAVGEIAVPHGNLTVTTPVTFGRLVFAPIVCAFLNAFPRVTVSALLLDRVANLVEEGIDAAVRIGSLPDSSLVARRIGEVRRVLIASPAYLAKRGRPQAPADLRLHSMIAFTGLIPNRELRFPHGKAGTGVVITPRLEVNDATTAIGAAEAGEGITFAVSYMVARQVRDGRLATILDDLMPPAVPVHLVHAQSRFVAPKVRAFVDFAGPRLQRALDNLSAARNAAASAKPVRRRAGPKRSA